MIDPIAQGMSPTEIARFLAHDVLAGNRPADHIAPAEEINRRWLDGLKGKQCVWRCETFHGLPVMAEAALDERNNTFVYRTWATSEAAAA